MPKYTSYRELQRTDLENVFLYDPIEGVFIKRKNNKSIEFKESYDDKIPQIDFSIQGKYYRIPAHTLAWVLHFGYFPEGVVLHRDLDKYNLRISNLLDVSQKHYKAFLTAHKNLNENCKVLLHPTDQYKFIVGFFINGKLRYRVFQDDIAAKEYIKIKKRQLIRQIRLLGGVIPENYKTELDLL
jgi:hypothetical protein